METDDLTLAGLDADERRELLILLEERERLTAGLPDDTRKPIAELLRDAVQAQAASTAHPGAYLAAWEQHKSAVDAHLARFQRQRNPGLDAPIEALMSALADDIAAADRLAAADGFPAPEVRAYRVGRPRTEPDRESRAPVKPAPIVAIEPSPSPPAPSTPPQPSSELAVPDRLAAFRGQGNYSDPPVFADGV